MTCETFSAPDLPASEFLVPADVALPAPRAHRPALSVERPIEVKSIHAMAFRVPVSEPVVTSFGIMRDRPAVLIRIEDKDGAVGWGEVWANFPSCGAEHRARLVCTALAPQLLGRRFESTAEAFLVLEGAMRILALQSGEWGPLAQALAGVDIALWDLVARRDGIGLQQALGGSRARVPVYASGINLADAPRTIESCRAQGFRAFKIKVGFGRDRDLAIVREVAAGLLPGEQIMFDANQAWDLATAVEMGRSLAEFKPAWLEEPIPADRPVHEWRTLRESAAIPIAGGENLRGLQAFEGAIRSRALDVLQPDACKWGGVTGCATVGRAALDAGLRYCPHFLGAGIGLITSAHLLAALGGDGLLEVDSNFNPLRGLLGMPSPPIEGGFMPIPGGAGLGVEPDLAQARQWLVFSEQAN